MQPAQASTSPVSHLVRGIAGHLPAGRGLLDYPLYLALLQHSGFTGALILHGLAEEDVAACLAFVRAAAPEGL